MDEDLKFLSAEKLSCLEIPDCNQEKLFFRNPHLFRIIRHFHSSNIVANLVLNFSKLKKGDFI